MRGLRAFAEGEESCSSGFYHGVVETVMARHGLRAVQRDPTQVCAPFRRRAPQGLAHYNCIHGMGHGFMGGLRSDVFRSLDGCGALPMAGSASNASAACSWRTPPRFPTRS